ncbi:acetyl-CoA carboxylase, carboxyltransferase subunit beta [Desulfotomaculum copahuensis]|uniref:Acetyl-coenzyme A carboxylase carboxyl transferase subunit beta n=1 Tax=Desulfotomaculum copahuensis TaxID=1838280 RepID=A0A1B7LGY5_9FIRM|nr:acetyl-CoA carboxylase, carboxyltransferase subunit beta [Desulfotomaculum copahuensis]OAT85452.1 acetyl-CoA carboxylase subunit beta [Desulfotomaculum copahuensis]
MLELFKKQKYVTVASDAGRREMPDGLWIKCPRCSEIRFARELEKTLKVCQKCGHHFRLTAGERIQFTLDEGTFTAYDADLEPVNPFHSTEYAQKLAAARQASGLAEAVVGGEGAIDGQRVVVVIMDAQFMMASMGTVAGEKITRAIERAAEKELPLIIFTASGGARMQEGVLSLMQMTKTVSALCRHSRRGLLYVTVLTDPTTGGVSASFAALGDIILAEPDALIGFAGPRVIEQTIRQKLPEGFQRAEFLRQHGFVDLVTPRPQLKAVLSRLLDLHRREQS